MRIYSKRVVSLVCVLAAASSLSCQRRVEIEDPLVEDADRRPVELALPEGDAPAQGRALVVLLHGYGSTATRQDVFLRLSKHAHELGFVMIAPNGTRDGDGEQFWAATPACCDFDDLGPDDVGYLRATIRAARERYAIDAGRVYLVGHSNGGFMSYTMACEMADELAGVLVIAGSTFLDDQVCQPSRPVRVLHLHGTRDDSVEYEDAEIADMPVPGAEEVAARWARSNGCDEARVESGPVSLTRGRGDESTRIDWSGCPPGSEVSLWRMDRVGHLPGLTSRGMTTVLEELLATDRTP